MSPRLVNLGPYPTIPLSPAVALPPFSLGPSFVHPPVRCRCWCAPLGSWGHGPSELPGAAHTRMRLFAVCNELLRGRVARRDGSPPLRTPAAMQKSCACQFSLTALRTDALRTDVHSAAARARLQLSARGDHVATMLCAPKSSKELDNALHDERKRQVRAASGNQSHGPCLGEAPLISGPPTGCGRREEACCGSARGL